MKVSVYTEDGIRQIIMTPEDKYEKEIVKFIENDKYEITVKKGEFYHCHGGYMRQYHENETENIIMVIKNAPAVVDKELIK